MTVVNSMNRTHDGCEIVLMWWHVDVYQPVEQIDGTLCVRTQNKFEFNLDDCEAEFFCRTCDTPLTSQELGMPRSKYPLSSSVYFQGIDRG